MAQQVRLMKELKMLSTDPPPGVSCWLKNGDVMTTLEADLCGPPSTPYEGGVFRLEIDCSNRYPFLPPKVRFITPIYHPNIDTAGRICLDLLKSAPKGTWKPSINLSTLLTSLQVLLAEPNPEDGLLPDVSSQYKFRREEFTEHAKRHTLRHAVKSQVPADTATNEHEPKTESSSPVAGKNVPLETLNGVGKRASSSLETLPRSVSMDSSNSSSNTSSSSSAKEHGLSGKIPPSDAFQSTNPNPLKKAHAAETSSSLYHKPSLTTE